MVKYLRLELTYVYAYRYTCIKFKVFFTKIIKLYGHKFEETKYSYQTRNNEDTDIIIDVHHHVKIYFIYY